MPMPSHVGLAQKLRLTRAIQAAAIKGDYKKEQELRKQLSDLKAKTSSKKK